MNSSNWLVLLPLSLASLPSAQAADAPADALAAGTRPALAVVISIDQFRADYLHRFADLFLPARRPGGKPGGFRWLMREGAWFLDARYRALPTFTCVGHATMLSGALPYQSGIVSNRWFDPAAGKEVYCVQDDGATVVGAGPQSRAKPMSARNLRVSTVGDELKMASAGAAKVVSVALKDRAAILMGGHAQDISLWYDDADGRWISSSAYARDGKLPAWVQALNDERIPDRSLGSTWTPTVPAAALARTRPAPIGAAQTRGFGVAFPHAVGAERNSQSYMQFALTPAANAFVFETARRAVQAERMGQDAVPDLLLINLSTNDYVGHMFGPDSPEVLDLSVATDRLLAEFFAFLDSALPGGLSRAAVVLTSDHGVSAVPEELQRYGVPGGRLKVEALEAGVASALEKAYGPGPWLGKDAQGRSIGGFFDPNLYLDAEAVQRALESGRAASRAQIEETAAAAAVRVDGIYAAYSRNRIESGALPRTQIGSMVTLGYHPQASGDVVLVTQPGFYAGVGSAGTSHGTVYTYDTHAALLIGGFGVEPGVHPETVSPGDIAPTLSLLLGVAVPNGSEARILPIGWR